MPGLGIGTLGYGYVWVVVCLLLKCLPPSFPAIVYPNDVLSSLEKYKSNSYGYDHYPKSKPTPPVSSPSFFSSSLGTASSSLGKVLLPAETSFSHHHSDSLVPTDSSSVSSSDLLSEFFNQENFETESARPVLPSESERVSEEDYEDYSDYPDSEPRPLSPSISHRARSEGTVPSVPEPLPPHRRLPSTEESHPKTTSHVRKDKSRVEKVEKERENRKVEKQTEGRHVHHTAGDRPSTERHSEIDKKQCPRCRIREEDRALRIESLKRKILDKLHFTTLPNRTGKPVPKALAHTTGIHTDLLQDSPYGRVYNQYYDDSEEEDDYTPPERVFTSAKPLPDYLKTGENNSCYFSMPAEVFRSRVTKAYLWFYVRPPRDVHSSVVLMQVNRLGPPYSKKHRSSKRVIWTHKAYPEKASGWKKVDLTNVMRRWVKHRSSNHGLEIQAMNGDENLAVLPPTSTEYTGYEPTLDIKVTKDGKRRYRRSDSLRCSENSTEHRCCRYPLTVSFAEFGWEWVIAPTHVQADYCSGECRMTLQNKTPYSWIASQTSDGGSCCTPSKMAALPLLYFDQGNDVVFQMLQNMQVERCGCA